MRLLKISALTIAIILLFACTRISYDNVEGTGQKYSDLEFVYINPDKTWVSYMNNEWASYMKTEYNIGVFINDTYENLYKLYNAGDNLSGLYNVNLYIPSYYDLFLPVTGYVGINEIWNKNERAFREFFADYRGDVWGIPTSISKRYFTRVFRKDWLDVLDLDIPGNRDELYEAVLALTYNDPNRSGRDDTKGIMLDESYIKSFYDVFASFGCYFDIAERFNQIAYNPVTKQYEDAAAKPEIIEAIDYVKALIDQNTFRKREGDMQINQYLTVGSDFTQYTAQLSSDIRLAIAKNNLGTCNQIILRGAGFMVLKDTNNPQKVIDSFMGVFYNDLKGHGSGRYGVYTEDFIIVQDELTVIKEGQRRLLDYTPSYLNNNNFYIYDNHFNRKTLTIDFDAHLKVIEERDNVHYIHHELWRSRLYGEPDFIKAITLAPSFDSILSECLEKGLNGEEIYNEYMKLYMASDNSKRLRNLNDIISR